ncbi:diguanylate cyclase [Candidatus Magnetomonas plexicatena]|uniref:diguanylate cyclase n=1 Tax=Candidatus Magnetomonas plexicatena TaxID=2552947 RepID=UPI0011002634|nr:GGDEF domain-containing protein [Nitrospirales bacterium LBB_01]
MNTDNILNLINMGIVILDRDYNVTFWNRWISLNTGVKEEHILGKSIIDVYPNLDNNSFLRNLKSVLTFGNVVFLSQKLHNYLFPIKLSGSYAAQLEFMQQSCVIMPLRDKDSKITNIVITVSDVTENVCYEKQLYEMNIKDSLTGIYNRGFFDIRYEEEFRRHIRYARHLSLIVFDVDYFKKINDGFGHQCGDLVLKNIALTSLKVIRDMDILARVGGEEFCCILPETTTEGAITIAERLRCEVSEMTSTYNNTPVKVTISLGVAELNSSMESKELLFELADSALYDAKRSGRNRVIYKSQH